MIERAPSPKPNGSARKDGDDLLHYYRHEVLGGNVRSVWFGLEPSINLSKENQKVLKR